MGLGQDLYDTLVPEGSPGRGVDAAILRQFDDNPGGGIFDPDTYDPTRNTQQGHENEIPLTGVDVTTGVGTGYQPLQGNTPGPQGVTGETIDATLGDFERSVDDAREGLVGGIPWLSIGAFVAFVVGLRAFAGGIGEGLVS